MIILHERSWNKATIDKSNTLRIGSTFIRIPNKIPCILYPWHSNNVRFGYILKQISCFPNDYNTSLQMNFFFKLFSLVIIQKSRFYHKFNELLFPWLWYNILNFIQRMLYFTFVQWLHLYSNLVSINNKCHGNRSLFTYVPGFIPSQRRILFCANVYLKDRPMGMRCGCGILYYSGKILSRVCRIVIKRKIKIMNIKMKRN